MPGPVLGRSFARRPDLTLTLPATLLVAWVALCPIALRANETHLTRPVQPAADAMDAQLARDPVWLALVHQARRKIDRRSRIAMHEADFFFHPSGTQRPDLELHATVQAFDQPDPDRARTARCRFPARHEFLARHGRVSSERGPCPELDSWRAEIGNVRLTLVFPEAFLGNPASMFGHTLLRFDPVDWTADASGKPLLGWTLDYTADAQGDVGAIYMMRGLVGGYRGRFSIAPYYSKIKVYGDWQDRDIWEYPLSMSRADLERVLLHIWELRDVTLPYYFFTQNCSEKLLEVLEVGWPGLGRGGGFPPAVTPVDTVRAMESVADGTLGEPILRPSPATLLQDAMRRITAREAALVETLADGRLTPEDASLDGLEPGRRAHLLTLAYDLLRHRYLAKRVTEEDSRTRSLALLRARSRMGRTAEPAQSLDTTDRRPPDQGHGTARVALAAGIQDRDGFLEFRLQPAYHTSLDAPGGFAEGGQIKVLDTRVRYFPEHERVRLHELVLLDVSTASPWRRPFRPLGWHLDLGLRTRLVSSDRDRGLDTEGVFRFQGGVGAAAAPARGLHLYSFGEMVLEAAPGIEGDLALGPLTRTGASYSTPAGRYTLQAETIAGLLTGPHTSAWLAVRLDQRLTLTRKWSATLGASFEHAYDVGFFESRLGLIRYF
ncbi:MAG: hypothetical protein CL908_21095 [Deltaproteobacteria bacterium]|nr:hypothetical protein [Deltaproteobacteria bacterium]